MLIVLASGADAMASSRRALVTEIDAVSETELTLLDGNSTEMSLLWSQ